MSKGLKNLMTKKTYHAHKDMQTIFGAAANKPAISDMVKRLGLTMEDEDTGEVILTPDEITARIDKEVERELDELFNYHKNNNTMAKELTAREKFMAANKKVQEREGASQYMKFDEVGVHITGTFQGMKDGDFQGKPTKNPIVENEEGTVIFLPSHASLVAKLLDCGIGSPVYIEMIGFKKVKNGTAYDYDVMY